MEKKTIYLIGAGVVAGGVILYLHKSKGSSTPNAGEGASTPLYGTGQEAGGSGFQEALQFAEARGQFEATEAKNEVEIEHAHELVTALEARPSALEEVKGARETLEGLGIPVGAGVSSPANVQATPSSTNSSNSESGSHLPSAPPAPVAAAVKALEAVPNSAHEWHLSTTGPTAGKYYYNGTYNGKSAHIYHASNFPGAVGPSHNLVIV